MRSPLFAATVAVFALAAAPARAEELKEGDAAPAFKAKGDDGKEHSLAALKGKTVVLYFYPKDDTPGCTIEAQEFRDAYEKFTAKGAVVLGVSLDNSESHQAFRKKYNLNFPLLVDGEAIAKAYGVPVSGGYAARQTFVIGKDGKLKKVFRKVNPRGHSAEILGLI
jgi:thioredoxin-dependent peroxiredoxin